MRKSIVLAILLCTAICVPVIGAADSKTATETEIETENYVNHEFFEVGKNFEEGEYVLFGENGFYMISSKDRSEPMKDGVYQADYESIIGADNFQSISVMRVEDGDFLELGNCSYVPIDEAEVPETLTEGIYKVGTQIPEGEYTFEVNDGEEHGYVLAYKDIRNRTVLDIDDAEKQNLLYPEFEGSITVTLKDGQYVDFSLCHINNMPEREENK